MIRVGRDDTARDVEAGSATGGALHLGAGREQGGRRQEIIQLHGLNKKVVIFPLSFPIFLLKDEVS